MEVQILAIEETWDHPTNEFRPFLGFESIVAQVLAFELLGQGLVLVSFVGRRGLVGQYSGDDHVEYASVLRGARREFV